MISLLEAVHGAIHKEALLRGVLFELVVPLHITLSDGGVELYTAITEAFQLFLMLWLGIENPSAYFGFWVGESEEGETL